MIAAQCVQAVCSPRILMFFLNLKKKEQRASPRSPAAVKLDGCKNQITLIKTRKKSRFSGLRLAQLVEHETVVAASFILGSLVRFWQRRLLSPSALGSALFFGCCCCCWARALVCLMMHCRHFFLIFCKFWQASARSCRVPSPVVS